MTNQSEGPIFFWDTLYKNIPHSSWKYRTRPTDSCGIFMTHAIQYYISLDGLL